MCRPQALQDAQVSRCDLPVRYSRHQAHVRVCKFQTRYHCSRHEARTHYTDSTPVQNLSMNDDTIDPSKMILLHRAGASVVHSSLALTRSALITLQDLNRRLTRIPSKHIEYLGDQRSTRRARRWSELQRYCTGSTLLSHDSGVSSLSLLSS